MGERSANWLSRVASRIGTSERPNGVERRIRKHEKQLRAVAVLSGFFYLGVTERRRKPKSKIEHGGTEDTEEIRIESYVAVNISCSKSKAVSKNI
jgi:hypothetical protein